MDLKYVPRFGPVPRATAIVMAPEVERDGKWLSPNEAAEMFWVRDADGGRLGLSVTVGDEFFYLKLEPVPTGATSSAWDGPFVGP